MREYVTSGSSNAGAVGPAQQDERAQQLLLREQRDGDAVDVARSMIAGSRASTIASVSDPGYGTRVSTGGAPSPATAATMTSCSRASSR